MIGSPSRPGAAPAFASEAPEAARRTRIGASDMGLVRPLGDARHSTSATIADRRFRAAIVVLRSLWRDPRLERSQAISKSLIVAAFLGFLLVVFLIVHSGAAEVGSAMLALGWWLAPITLYHLLPLYFDAASWRELFPAANRPGRLSFLWMRWIRESVSTLLPVAGVGGDVVGARLVHQRGVSGAQATASMVVDVTVGSATQLVFVLVGVGLLTAAKTHDAAATAWGLTIGVAIFAAAIGVFVRLQHNSMFATLIGWANRLAPKSWVSGFTGRAETIDEAIVATYRRRLPLSYSSLLRIIGWVIGTGEVWIATRVLGHPLSLIDSFILESLSSGVRGAAFMVPGALGAQESGMVLFGALLGLPADLALAVSLTKRVRELALGLPGLGAWQWLEGRRFLARQTDQASSTP
jgi:putative membrane protein